MGLPSAEVGKVVVGAGLGESITGLVVGVLRVKSLGYQCGDAK